ncbi:MAG: hypothetical protein V6Z86_09895, partial [Hyphomicrobiales bacterium]
ELTIGHSRVVAIRTRSGNDVSDIFMREMDALLANNLIELALGTNAGAVPSSLDWRYNSPVNESALGFHVGLGDGSRCAHVDFMCPSQDSYDSFFKVRE